MTIKTILRPLTLPSLSAHVLIAIPRILCGLLLCLEFGSSKFGMPWSTTDEMGLFQVAEWFPKDVAAFGFPYDLAPGLFAWMGAATEAIGGIFIALGLGTRIWAALLALTMMTAVFLQKWPEAMEYGSSWPLLPAAGFLWLSLFLLVTGSGKLGIDYWISRL